MNYDLKGKSPSIPIGSLVLVTGVNGFIGSHVADQLLLAGYRVRGTVRSESKGEWVKELFDKKYGEGKVEIVIVANMSQAGAFDAACEGNRWPPSAIMLELCDVIDIFRTSNRRLRHSPCRLRRNPLPQPQRSHPWYHRRRHQRRLRRRQTPPSQTLRIHLLLDRRRRCESQRRIHHHHRPVERRRRQNSLGSSSI